MLMAVRMFLFQGMKSANDSVFEQTSDSRASTLHWNKLSSAGKAVKCPWMLFRATSYWLCEVLLSYAQSVSYHSLYERRGGSSAGCRNHSDSRSILSEPTRHVESYHSSCTEMNRTWITNMKRKIPRRLNTRVTNCSCWRLMMSFQEFFIFNKQYLVFFIYISQHW